jgi:hypothetical protein
MKKYVLKYFEIILIIAIILLAISETWIGVWALLLFYGAFVCYKLWKVFSHVKPFSSKGMVADSVRLWETQQLGYDLDSDYWLDKKKPNLYHKFMGINPNWSKEQNAQWKKKVKKIQDSAKKKK